MVDVSLVAQLALNGLLLGSVYGLAALGLSLIWGVMRVVNIAHGELMMLSAFATYWLFVLYGMHPFLAVVVTVPLGFAIGLGLYRFFVRPVLRRADQDMMSLVLMLGFQAVFYGFASYSWGIDIRSIPILLPSLTIGSLTVPWSRLSTALVAMGLVVATYLFLRRTSYGKAIRAVTQSRSAAMLVGINPDRVFLWAFGLGGALASVAGSLLTLTNPAITPLMGLDFLLRSFAIVVLGGLGNPVGALVGGVVLGVSEGLSSLFTTLTATIAIAFVILIIVLVLRPEGLFGAMR